MVDRPERLLFRPAQRLLTKSDYSQVFEKCSTRVTRGPILVLAAKSTQSHPRLGLVVRKKFIKSAVQRNTFKRITRECFRLNQYQLPAMDIVVMNRSGSDTLNKPQLQRLITKAFHALARQTDDKPQ